MPDDYSSGARRGQEAEGGRLWQGLKNLLFGSADEPTLREQLEEAIDEAEADEARERDDGIATGDGDLSRVERQMLRNLLHFGEQRVDDVAVPRADIIAIPESASFADVVAAFAEAGHSRLPVYRETLDSIVGMIHIKDVFEIMATGRTPPATLEPLLRQPRYVPQSMGVLDLLADMRATRTHLAIVIDEYSGTEGLVTIEDLVEEIIGDIEDEHDDAPEDLVRAIAPGLWDVEARAELDDVAEAIGDARVAETEEDVDTIGGLAVALAGHVPDVGAVLPHPSGWRIEVLAADDRRIERLRLHAPVPATVEDA